MRSVRCPICGAAVVWGLQSKFRPFCSERCRQIDLGAWASDGYCVPGEASSDSPPDDFSEVPPKPATSRE
ncbi:MAG: DNA gyrase inhibitor YacG [Gammaproteobacteria bacterium]|nr:DNA gyrase inhibitor YacG [Gammaproteobacteria bacterium]MBU3988714.1 DNA gyrase inhibitor YacG [Gammaproteobacteria bacterium]MBU4005502.1 DNA gyrase inhibitor YacG [Gammaproteobacteria bacterium]MBU4020945.1 DNA gyrase inhibitor YacG [Gammaproteobacteria bacterium]MBU4096764.1 DNA gyrase inhibitor YacG [Gammaproteobacteria bacterium]